MKYITLVFLFFASFAHAQLVGGGITTQAVTATSDSSRTYPFASGTLYPHKKLIKDVQVYNYHGTQNLYAYQIGYVAGGWVFSLIEEGTNNFIGGANLSNWLGDTSVYQKIEITGTAPFNVHGYVIMDVGAYNFNDIYYNAPQYTRLDARCVHSENDPAVILGTELLSNSILLTDSTDLYAHEAHVATDDKFIYCAASINKYNSGEGQARNECVIFRINKMTKKSIRLIVARPGNTYGTKNIPLTSATGVPRIYFIGDNTKDSLRCYFGIGDSAYYRDYNILTQTFSPQIYPVLIIPNGGGSPVYPDSTVLKNHLIAVTGTTQPYFSNLKFEIRNDSKIQKIGAYWYLTAEYGSTGIDYFKAFPLLMRSSDGGITWNLLGSPYLGFTPEATVPRFLENHMVYDNNTFYMFSRFGDNVTKVATSTDGITWTSFSNILPIPGTKGLRQTSFDITVKTGKHYIVAYNTAEIMFPSLARSAMKIVSGNHLGQTKTIARLETNNLCHYPSVYADDSFLYCAYTTVENKFSEQTLKSAIRLSLIPLSKLF